MITNIKRNIKYYDEKIEKLTRELEMVKETKQLLSEQLQYHEAKNKGARKTDYTEATCTSHSHTF
jgi:prefoldin subunit 5